MRIPLLAAGVLLAALLAVYLYTNHSRTPAADPAMQRLSELSDLADRSCLSNTSDAASISLHLKLEAVGHVDASAGLEQQHHAARGAAEALAADLQRSENDAIRACLAPWAEQIRAMAEKL
jgi:hypothetical protein